MTPGSMIYVQKVQCWFFIQVYCQCLLSGEQLYWIVIYVPCVFPEIAALEAILCVIIHSLLRNI